jgi:anti-sigma-K factor RskA
VAAHREVAALLGNAGGAAPEGIWDRIAAELAFESARQERTSPPAPGIAAPIGTEPGRAREVAPRTGSSPGAEDGRGTPGELAAARARRRWRVGGAVALGAVAAALAVVVGLLSARVSDLDQRVSAVQSAMGSQSLAQRALAASLDPNDVQVKLAPSPKPTAPAARLIVDRRSGTAYFVSTGLAPLPSSRTYQLWSLVGGKPVSIAVLGPRAQASQLQVSPDMSTFMVTAEPEGGTPQPTGPVLVQGTIPHTT